MLFYEKSLPKLYYPELKIVTKTVIGAILWHQLEYWFWICRKNKKQSFYKFINPPKEKRGDYRKGDSWTEELGISKHEFYKAFDTIGTRWGSSNQLNMQKQLEGEEVEFNNKMYKSVFYRFSRRVEYYRDDKIVNAVIRDNDLEQCFDFDKTLLKAKSNSDLSNDRLEVKDVTFVRSQSC